MLLSLARIIFALPLTDGQWEEFSQDFIISSSANTFDMYIDIGEVGVLTGSVFSR